MTSKILNRDCEDLLLDYAAGTLDPAHTLIIATYLTLSPAARRYVDACEALGGALIEYDCEQVEVSAACLAHVLEKISCTPEPCIEDIPCCNQTCISCDDVLPAPLAHLLPAGQKPVWRKTSGGMMWIDVPVAPGSSRAQLKRCGPGFKWPRHTQSPFEIMLVLEGAFRDEYELYRRGDLLVISEASAHQPVADLETGCLCFTVTAQPVPPGGFFAKLRHRLSQSRD